MAKPETDRTDSPPPASGTGMADPAVRAPTIDEDEVEDPVAEPPEEPEHHRDDQGSGGTADD